MISFPRLWLPRAVGHWSPYRRLVAGLCHTADLALWRTYSRVDKFAGDVEEFRARYGKEEGERRFYRDARLVGVAEAHLNVLTTVGANLLLTAVTSATNSTPFNTANAALGVGDSTTAASAGQTNLIASSNAYRQVMDSGYPIISTNQATFRCSVGTSNANFHWQELGAFSSVGTGSPPTGGTMLNRLVTDLGTKTSAASWVLSMTFSLS